MSLSSATVIMLCSRQDNGGFRSLSQTFMAPIFLVPPLMVVPALTWDWRHILVGILHWISQSLRYVAKHRAVPENIMSNVLLHNLSLHICSVSGHVENLIPEKYVHGYLSFLSKVKSPFHINIVHCVWCVCLCVVCECVWCVCGVCVGGVCVVC